MDLMNFASIKIRLRKQSVSGAKYILSLHQVRKGKHTTTKLTYQEAAHPAMMASVA